MENLRFKFRAWDKLNYRFLSMPLVGIDFENDCVNSYEIEQISDTEYKTVQNVCYSYELMQYTRLKDKNGVEIYEGDIVRDGSRLWKIEISPIYGIFFILSKGGHTRCYGDFASYLVDDFQVIGNIYEQSYLLDNNS